MNSPTDSWTQQAETPSVNPMPNRISNQPDSDDRPRRRVSRRRKSILIWGPLLAILVGAAGYYGWTLFRGVRAPFRDPTASVVRQALQVVIVERGTLESAENNDIVCRVKAGKKGNSGIIKWVIDDGAHVDKGQKLIEIDDSALQEELQEQVNKVNKTRSDWIASKEAVEITRSQNFDDEEAAKTKQVLARIEITKFLGEKVADKVLKIATRAELQRYLLSHVRIDLGESAKTISEILQTISDIEGRVEIARSDRELLLDKASWSQRMVKNGYLSRSTADADKSRLASADFTLRKAQVEYDLFLLYTVEQKVTELWSKVKEVDRGYEIVKTQGQAKLNKDMADLESKKAIYDQELDRKEEIDAEIRKCVLFAPQAGLVVYYVSEQSRSFTGTQQLVAQGEAVKEGQKLMRIPNLARMQVNARVHEAMVSKLRGEINRPTGFGEVTRIALSSNQFLLATLANQAAFEEMRDQLRPREFEAIYSGQKAFVRVDAHPSKIFQGRVKTVATVASSSDWMSSDVKVYPTIVSIEDTVLNLKPGMSVEVTILAEESTEPVLTIPIQSVAGSITMGAKRKCFVVQDGQPKERDVVIGRSNDKFVEVTEGLDEGETVVLNPRPLLTDRNMKTGTPATRRGVGDEEMSGAGGKKGAGKKGGFKGGDVPPGGPGGLNPNGPAGGKQFIRPEGFETNGKKS